MKSLIVLLSLLISGSIIAEDLDYTYVNNEAQLAIDYPSPWKIYSEEKDAPPEMKPVLGKLRPEGLVFMGRNGSSLKFSRLLLESYSGGIDGAISLYEEFFKSQNIVLIKNNVLKDQYLIYVEYDVENEGAKFHMSEYWTTSDNYLIRIGFWTLGNLFDAYRPEIESIIANAKYLSKYEGKSEWVSLFEGFSTEAQDEKVVYEDEHEYPGYVIPEDRKFFAYTIKGKKNKVHLFGSIHFGNKDFYPFPEPIENAFASSKTLVLEVNESDPENVKVVSNIMTRMLLPKGKTLKDVLKPKQLENLNKYATKNGLSIEPFMSYQPWAVILFLSQSLYSQQELNSGDGVEKYFTAQLGDKKIEQLENVEFQISLFEKMNIDDLLIGIEDEGEREGNNVAELVEAWLTADEAKMLSLLGPSEKTKFTQTFIYDRNVTMTKKIQAYLNQDKDVFIVMGAMHLVGPKGILALLKAKGLKVDKLE